MPKTKRSKVASKKAVSKRKASVVTVKAPHMTQTMFGAFYLFILAILSLTLITISSNLGR